MQKEATDSFVCHRLYEEVCHHIETLSGFLLISRHVIDSRNKETVNALRSLYGCLLLTA